jgi:hypothetical protein
MVDKVKERLGLPIYGRIREDIFRKKPNGQEELVKRGRWSKNKIVDSAGKLIAGLLANYTGFTGGILYHAIGEGTAAWGPTPPEPGDSDDTLYSEDFRKQPATILFVEEVAGQADSGTNLVITTNDLGSYVNDYFNGFLITITAGTNEGETRLVKDFRNLGATQEIEVDEAYTAPVDASTEFEIDEPVAPPPLTDKIEIKTVFSFGDGTDGFYIREQGLFGGDATAAVDSGVMINALRHPPIWKDSTVKIVRYIQLDFVRTT